MANEDVIHVPPSDSLNTALTTPRETFMLHRFGTPGVPDPSCVNEVTGSILRPLMTQGKVDVGPFRVQGMKIAVESLAQIFDEVRVNRQDLYDGVKEDGMLCVRRKRGTSGEWSNHAFGIAIDLFFGPRAIDRGDPHTYRGILDLYFYFHKHGWYWGGGYRGGSVDSMHFEMSEELIEKLA